MPPYVVRLSTCNLNQWALDFEGNLSRVHQSIAAARAQGSRFRTGPELELTGYGCEDHFLESDTTAHAWESLAALLEGDATRDFLVDVGLPLRHAGVLYNARAFCLNGRVLLLRPKMSLAEDGNYREGRYFSPWSKARGLETFTMPACVSCLPAGQTHAPIGFAALRLRDGILGAETCEELFTPDPPHIQLLLSGCDIIVNGSGSHHQLRKLNTRVELMQGATDKVGGAYLYANQRGCDGGRLYYDGCAMIMANGACVAQGEQFGLRDVEVLTAGVDLEAGRSMFGASASAGRQGAAAVASRVPLVEVDYFLGGAGGAGEAATTAHRAPPTPPRPVAYVAPAEEIGRGPACWLWDFLRRSGAGGFFLPLSGGADSAATAAIVGIMAHMVAERAMRAGAAEAAAEGAAPGGGGGGGGGGYHPHAASEAAVDAAVLADLRRVARAPTLRPASAAHIAGLLFHTAYLGTANSSEATRRRAGALAGQLGAHHSSIAIDAMVGAVLWVFAAFVSGGRLPRFSSRGGSAAEDLALQNVQARLRMVISYFLAQLLPWVRRSGGGFLLVLGSSNVDEALRGYYTKYDCSAADLNPIGGVSKRDLAMFLRDAAARYAWPALLDIVHAPPTAELRPMGGGGGGGGGGGPPSPHQFGVDDDWGRAGATFQLPDPGAAAAAATAEAAAAAAAAAAALTVAPASGTALAIATPVEHSQTDEADMGMTYDELSVFGGLRKTARCGPLSMYSALLSTGAGKWASLTPRQVAAKVKHFFVTHAANRHKMTTLTPSYHAEGYSPDDNRYDHRPFLYPLAFARQFAAIDADVEAREAETARGRR
jgi:NAD+ synthase (glutamine-hydrolysing)